jgi:hypothetical protein
MSGKRSRGKASSQTDRTKLQPDATPSDPATPASNHVGNGQDGKDAQLLKEAVANPGAAEVPDAPIQAGDIPVMEVPAADTDPDAGEDGEVLEADPALITTPIEQPSPDIEVLVYPELSLRAQLLKYGADKNDRAEWYFVHRELAPALAHRLRFVRVYLLAELSYLPRCFLWPVLESTRSPYHNCMTTKVLARGDEFVRQHKFLFEAAQKGEKASKVRAILRSPDDPVPTLPTRSIGKLLYEALLPERVINSTAHPVYQKLTAGRAL